MLDQDDGDARGGNVPDHRHEMIRLSRAEASHRLVHEEKLRTCGKRTREHQELAIEHWEGARRRIVLAGEAHGRKRFIRVGFGLLAGREAGEAPVVTPEIGGDPHIVAQAQGVETGVELEGARDAGVADGLRRQARDVTPREGHRPAGRGVEAGDDVEQRRLAGPIGAANAQDLALGHLEGEIVDRRQRTEMLGNPAAGQQCRTGGGHVSSSRIRPSSRAAAQTAPCHRERAQSAGRSWRGPGSAGTDAACRARGPSSGSGRCRPTARQA